MFEFSYPKSRNKFLVFLKTLVALILIGTLLVGCGSKDEGAADPTPFPEPVSVGPLPPALVETSPMQGSELPLSGAITLYFNQPMERASVESALSWEAGILGSFSWLDDSTVTIAPSSPLQPDTELSISINESAQAANGLTMQETVSLEYKTVGYMLLTQSLPVGDTFDIDPTSAVVASFNRPIVPLGADPASLEPAFSVTPTASGRGEWLNTSTYIFYPQPGLDGGKVYTVKLDPGLTSTDGAPLEESVSWTFHTAEPEIISSTPGKKLYNIFLDEHISLTFNQPMNPESVERYFSLVGGEGNLAGTFEWNEAETKVTFTPNNLLQRGKNYSYHVEPQAAARGGTQLGERYVVNFSTVGDFAVADTSPYNGGQKSYYGAVTLNFNAPLGVEDATKYFSVDPAIDISIITFDQAIYVHGVFESGKTYTLKLASGLVDKWGDAIEEDFVLDFGVTPPKPRLTTSSYLGQGVVFVDPQDPVISAQALNVSTVDVLSGSIPLTDFFWLRDDYEAKKNYNPADSESNQVKLNISSDIFRVVRIPLTAKGSLSPGVYWYATSSLDLLSTSTRVNGFTAAFAVVSNVHMVYKISPTDALVWAVDTRTDAPVTNTPVTIYSDTGDVIVSGQTDNSGVFYSTFSPHAVGYTDTYAVLSSPGDDLFSLATSSWDDGIAPWEFGYRSDFTYSGTKYYLYTDRPIYRPGQTVNFRAIVREEYNGRYQFPILDPIPVTVYGGSGEELDTYYLSVSEFGTGEGAYTLSEEAEPGYYRIRVNDEYYGATFQVAEYRKPEIDIEVSFPKDEFLLGEGITGEVSSRYFFDAPAGNLDLEWNLYIADSYFYLPGYTVGPTHGYWGGRYYPSSYLGSWIDGGSATTSPEGLFSVDLPLQEADEIQNYTLEVLVTDESGFPVASRSSATVHPADFYIGVKSDRWVGQADTEMNFDILVVDWDRDPAGEKNLHATFSQVDWVPKVSPLSGNTIYEKQLTEILSGAFSTDGQGQSRLGFTPPSPGIYQLDVSGGGALTQKQIWVSGSTRAVWPNFDNNQIRLVADEENYQIGDVAQVFIPNPFGESATALVSIERSLILSSQVIEISGSGMTLPISLSSDSAPNVYLSVTLVGREESGKMGFRQGVVNLEVEPEEHILNVEVISQPERTAPGEVVTFSVKVTDHTGAPVQGEFSLSVVDEAVLALADPFEEDIVSAFYGIQPMGVDTNVSLIASATKFEELMGGKGGGGGDVESSNIRTEFKDTAYWNAQVVTGPDGIANVEAKLPDNLTTWRVHVRGLTVDTLVGEAVSEVVTTKQLLVRPVTPRFVVAGDHFQIGAVVHNNSTTDLSVSIALQSKGYALDDLSEALQEIDIPAGGRVRVDWWGTVEDVDEVELVFAADGGGLSDVTIPTAGTLPVLNYVAPQVFSTSGILEQGGERLELVSLPRTFDPTNGGLTLELSPSLAGTVLQGLDILEHFQYECTEQTVSRFLPNLEAYLVIQQFGLDSPVLEARLDRTVQDAIIKLESEQNYDGGWGWYRRNYGDSNPYVTAYALLGLMRADQAGYSLQPNTLENAIDFLIEYVTQHTDVGQLDDPALLVSVEGIGGLIGNMGGGGAMHYPWEYDRAAFISYVLGQAKYPVHEFVSFLYENHQKMNPWGQAFLGLAMIDTFPNDDRVNTIFSNLQATAIRSSTGAHWDETAASWQNMSSNMYNNAVVVFALAQHDPASPLLSDAVRYLVGQRDAQGSWRSTYSTSWTIMALTEFMQGTGELGGEFAFSASLNDILLASGQASGSNQLVPVNAEVGIESLLSDEPNALKFMRDPGTGRLYYRASLQVSRPVEDVQELSQGVSVARAYYPYGVDCVSEECIPVNGAQAGDLVNVRVTLTLPNSVYYLAVEDYIPAGTEVLDTSLKTSQLGSGGSEEGSFDHRNPFSDGWGWWYFDRPHIYDDHITWMAEFLPAGTHELSYTLVVLQPGSFGVIPARAWQFYFPEVQGNSAGTIFEITP